MGVSKRCPKVHTSHIDDRSNNTPDTHHKEQSDETQNEREAKTKNNMTKLAEDRKNNRIILGGPKISSEHVPGFSLSSILVFPGNIIAATKQQLVTI